jgi:hypothetical protein
LSEPFCAKRFSNFHLQYIQPRSHDDTCSSLLVAVWSGFGLFTRPHCSLYSPFLTHNLHHIGRLPATLHSSYHPETLIAKSKGLPEIHHNQEPRLIKQSSPPSQPWRPPQSSIANTRRRRRTIRRKTTSRHNISQLLRHHRAELHRTRLPITEPSVSILKSRIRARAARTYRKLTPRRKRSVYTVKRTLPWL